MTENEKKEIISQFDGCDVLFDLISEDDDSVERVIYFLDKHSELEYTKYQYGASKLVIEFEKFPNYVIKIPILYDYDGEKPFQEGAYSEITEENSDYCQQEMNIYDLSEEYELEDFFAKTEYIGKTLEGYPIYIQERVIPEDEYTGQAPSDKSQEEMEGRKFLGSRFWSSMVLDFCGDGLLQELKEFICKYSGDIHDGNVGYRKDSFPVILDYSGFGG